jgi:hypothetical protein
MDKFKDAWYTESSHNLVVNSSRKDVLNMKSYRIYPLLSLAGGAAALVLRILQNQTGYETDTGLPIPGNLYARLLPILLAALVVLFVLLARRIPTEHGASPLSFQDCFRSTGSAVPTLLALGAFLWIGSGVLSLWGGFRLSGAVLDSAAATQGILSSTTLTANISSTSATLLIGALTVLAGACMLPVITVCRYRGRRSTQKSKLTGILLIPVVCLVIRLILTYREDSINPSLSVYYVELLALAGLILTLYRASSFAYHDGRTFRFVLYAQMTVVLCFAMLPDSTDIPRLFFYGGGILLSLGLLSLRLSALVWAETPASSEE